MRHLSSVVAASLLVGVAGGVGADLRGALGVLILLCASAAVGALAFRRGHTRIVLAALVVWLAAAGWGIGRHAVDRALHPPLRTMLSSGLSPGRSARLGAGDDSAGAVGFQDFAIIEGRLRRDVARTPAGAVLRLDVERIWLDGVARRTAGGVSLGVAGTLHDAFATQWTAGRVIRAPVRLRRPARYLNRGAPDQERRLAMQGVSLVGSIKSAALVDVVRHGRWWEEAAARIRARTRAALRRHVGVHGDQSAAIAAAILIGDRAGLDDAVASRLQQAGTYHVIAISGGNIAILAGLVIGVLGRGGIRGRAAALVTIAVLGAYFLVASGGPSVLRATVMAVVYLGVRVIDQRTAAVNAVSLTAAAMLLASPLAVADVGFWLTFGATLALIAASVVALPVNAEARELTADAQTHELWPAARPWQVTRRVGRLIAQTAWTHGKRLRTAVALVVVGTMGVELVLAPVSALVFERVTIAGLALNLVALPAMSVVQLAAMGVVVAEEGGLAAAAGGLGWVVHLAAGALTESTRLLDAAPWLTWRVPPPHFAVLAIYFVSLGAALGLAWRPAPPALRHVARAVAAVAFLWIVVAPAARLLTGGDGRLHVTMFDVGQGDALLVVFPNGRRLLVDAGGTASRGGFDVGDRVVGPALRARGLLTLDYLAVTHADADHIGGAAAIIRDFAPREIWWGVPVAHHPPTEAVQTEAALARAGWRLLQRGDRIDIGGVTVRVRHPPPADWERQRVRNGDSLVFELRFGDVSVLLTGDIDRDVENDLAGALDLAPQVVLKVAHHGSATSSSAAFLDRVRPAVAFIGVGRANLYGHPAPPVLRRLRQAGADIFSTDRDGQIDIVTDGTQVQVTTWSGRHLAR